MSEFAENIELPVAYLKTLSLYNVRSFKKENEIFFTKSDGKSARWTVILGNNNTGKTTILKCIADLYLRTEKIDSLKIQMKNESYERTNEDSYFIHGNKKSIELITHKKGEYNVEMNVLGEFPPTLIDKSTKKGFFPEPRWGISIKNDEVLGIAGHPHMRKIFLQGYSTSRNTAFRHFS